ncbi:peroxiredoxin-like family protein [Aquimarina sp. 2-A2]|uniref:peroxiredoxin-like family protein n=1 Tax=Aquimarina sp. 2-A2 TaxID=3382644 RepID=UPI00387F1543
MTTCIFEKKDMIKPRTKVPELELDLINDTKWSLADQNPDNYSLLVFYRGLHCPVCKKYLEDLTTRLDDFVERGVNVIAISGDSEERAKKTGDQWKIPSLPVGYELSMDEARNWGLFVSEGISDKEPEKFSEPGVFLVKPDRTLYFSAVQTMPFARPSFKDILNAIDYIQKEEYPARGEA